MQSVFSPTTGFMIILSHKNQFFKNQDLCQIPKKFKKAKRILGCFSV